MRMQSNSGRGLEAGSIITALGSMALAIAIITSSTMASAGKGSVEVVAPGKTLFGKSYNELTSEWSNWLQKEPIETSPANDPDGRYCDANQSGKVWFLAGTFGGVADRFCEVPAGMAVFFPFFANISFAPDFLAEPPCDPALTEPVDLIRCDVNDDTDIAPFVGLTLVIDGVSISDLYAYRTQSEAGGFVLEIGPLFEGFGVDPGPRFPAVTDGYWILLNKLPPGEHTIEFSSDFGMNGVADLGANYTLQVGDDDDD
jgi:hypothetical protein